MLPPERFRELCGRFATGVAIVTARDAAGNPVGMTASSFASTSLAPPLISIAVDRAATAHPALMAAPHFVVNILADGQEVLSRRFASGLADRFDGVGWHSGDNGEVLLDGALAHLSCEKRSVVGAGDHTVFFAEVTGGTITEQHRPLLHYRGGYTDLGER